MLKGFLHKWLLLQEQEYIFRRCRKM